MAPMYTQDDIEQMKSLCLNYDIVRKMVAGFVYSALLNGDGNITPQVIQTALEVLANNSDKIDEAIDIQVNRQQRPQ